MSVVRPAYGPTLPQLLGARRWRVVRAFVVLVAVAIAVIAIAARASSSDMTVVSDGEPAFNYAYAPPLRKVGGTDVEERRGGLFIQSMQVTRLALPAYRGDSGGTLPIMADRLVDELAGDSQLRGFASLGEGRARINDNPGYYIAWEAMRGGRRLFGRDYLLVPDEQEAPRTAVRLRLMSTYAGGVASSDDVGRAGKLKQTLRSFRFGTERP